MRVDGVAQDTTTEPAPEGIQGKITKIDGANIKLLTVDREGKEKEVTVKTDDNTVFKVDGKDATLADLKADMAAFVTPPEGVAKTVTARVIKPPATLAYGEIVQIEGANITVSVKGKEVTFKTDDKTEVTIDRKEARLSDLCEHMKVVVTAVKGLATKISAHSKS